MLPVSIKVHASGRPAKCLDVDSLVFRVAKLESRSGISTSSACVPEGAEALF